MNFTRPFCQNYGITLPSYVYRTPADQIWNNDLGNTNARSFEKVRASRVSRFLNISVATYGKCLRALFTYYCHRRFPSCDRTQNVVVEQKVCRESCLEMIHICGKIYDVLFKYSEIRFPKRKKRYRCELQPYRNAGDSPECYYYSLCTNSTGKTRNFQHALQRILSGGHASLRIINSLKDHWPNCVLEPLVMITNELQ